MAKTDVKTVKNNNSVLEFLNSIKDSKRREDGLKLLKIFNEVLNDNPKMWGDSMVGYGNYHYKYVTGREGDMFKVGFSPRKQYLSIYTMGYTDMGDLLNKLGKHKLAKACLYIKDLNDIDINVLKEIIKRGWDMMEMRY